MAAEPHADTDKWNACLLPCDPQVWYMSSVIFFHSSTVANVPVNDNTATRIPKSASVSVDCCNWVSRFVLSAVAPVKLTMAPVCTLWRAVCNRFRKASSRVPTPSMMLNCVDSRRLMKSR